MPIVKLEFAPGIDREGTNYSAEGSFFDGDKIRFRSGKAEKIGGWQRISAFTYKGVARHLINWSTLSGANYTGIGTNLKYYIEDGGAYNDITPIRKTTDPMAADPFQTAFDALATDITATQSTIPLTDASTFCPTGGIIRIGSEEMFYAEVTGDDLIGVVRGFNGTTAAPHSTAAPVSSSTIIVTDVNHEAVQNDFVTFADATSVGGFADTDLNQEQQIFEFISPTQYAINIEGVFSTSASAGGGAVVKAEYQANTGLDTFTVGVGWGSDPWGSGGWGDPGTVGIGQQLRLWSGNNYGEDLIFNPRQGPIYYWEALLGTTQRGVFLSDLSTAKGFSGQFVPHTTNKTITAPTERFVLALGANPYDPTDPDTPFDPMLVRWSDQDNQYEWAPAVTNQAGDFRLSHGSFIVGSTTTRQEILIWTDTALYSAQYVGPPYVWGFNIMGDNISIISPNAMITANNVTYWMGNDKFYAYSGRVETLPCALRQYIFSDINRDQGYQIHAGTNERFNEIWWFYCSNGSTVINKYVVYNYLENVWYYGTLGRTAWIDAPLREYPMAADYLNQLVFHEIGTDDLATAAPQPINAYIQSADFDIGDGDHFAFVWRILPDINFTNSSIDHPSVEITLKPRRNAGAPYGPADSPVVKSENDFRDGKTYVIQEFNGQVTTRIRGRQMALRVESKDLGVAWQLGSVRADIKIDGNR